MYRKLIPYDARELTDELVGYFVRMENENRGVVVSIAGTVTHRAGCDLYVKTLNGDVDSFCLQYGETYVTTIDDYIDPTIEPSLRETLRSRGE